MSRIDSLKEAKRGIGVSCECGKPARVTVRGLSLCYKCLDRETGYFLDPTGYPEQRMRERVREIDRRYLNRRNITGPAQPPIDNSVRHQGDYSHRGRSADSP